ncbi:hypothetical protein D9757_009450 [Collybiopsis confluens]|uniref:F-box domain-containing protein n=1 Tax=Collybiopsis confluens TaxID=2823264 RepID=A0A8H5M4R5_9AGAR|nr:hypothetical protein D9757_009450 [Collybiopsis confluens]
MSIASYPHLKRRRAESNYSRQQLSLLSPVRKLPAEILEQVFAAVCVYGLELRRDSVKTVTISLSQVCSSWRRLILIAPRLWSGPGLYVDLLVPLGVAEELISIYLERSSQAPLKLFITASTQPPETYRSVPPLAPRALVRFLMLLDTSSRWKEAHIQLPWSANRSIPAFRNIGDINSFHSLEELRIFWDTDMNLVEEENDGDFFELFSDAPNLRHLTIPSALPLIGLPWSQLTSLGPIRDGNTQNILHVLERCQSVHSFVLKPKASPGVSEKELVGLHEIGARSLSFLRDRSNSIKLFELMSHLTAKNLVSLIIQGHITGYFNQGSWDSPLKDFLSRSGCSLRSLTLDGNCTGIADALLDLLPLVPTLTYLKVVWTDLEDHPLFERLFERLTIPSETTSVPILPSLEIIDLDHHISFAQVTGYILKILNMAESRSRSLSHFDSEGHMINSRLTSLSVGIRFVDRVNRAVYLGSVEKMRASKEGGMKVQINIRPVIYILGRRTHAGFFCHAVCEYPWY